MADKSLEQLQRENIQVQNEHLREQTDFYKDQNEHARNRRLQRAHLHSTQEETLELGRKGDIRRWRGCTHRKGGKGDDLKNNHGNDPNYAIVIHTYPDQRTCVMCTRCQAEWQPGDTAQSHPTGIAYETAIAWPTDNSPSVAAQFMIPQRRPQPVSV